MFVACAFVIRLIQNRMFDLGTDLYDLAEID